MVGGLMVMLHGRRRATAFTITHRPWSWLSVVRRLGVGATLRQVRDLIQVMHRTSRLASHDYIAALYVDDRVRRSGVARTLLALAVADSNKHGVNLGVDTLQGNHAAHQLYESCGFREWTLTTRSTIFTLVVD